MNKRPLQVRHRTPPPCNSLPHSNPLRGSSFGSGAGQAQRFWSLRGGDLYIFVPTYCERQICTYFYWCPVRERFVHMFTGVLWERDLYIVMPASCEREIRAVHACTMQLTVRERESCIQIFPVSCVRERFLHICASFRWERDLYCTYEY